MKKIIDDKIPNTDATPVITYSVVVLVTTTGMGASLGI